MSRRATDYAWEKLFNAVTALVGSADLPSRLHGAYLAFHTLRTDDFLDPVLKDEFAEINALIGQGGISLVDVEARMRTLNEEDLALIRDSVWKLAYAVIVDHARRAD